MVGRRGGQSKAKFQMSKFGTRKVVHNTCSFTCGEDWQITNFNPIKGDNWHNSKHRIVLSPSSKEKKLLGKKMVNLASGASGPTNCNCKDDDEDDFHIQNFDWKGKRGSFGDYETRDLTDYNSVHPLRLLYPKRAENPRRKSVCHCDRKTEPKNHFKRAKYNYEEDNNDWLKLKHRILLYPSSNEKSFLKRKMANPVPKALGPRDIDDWKLPIESRKYDCKEKVESLGEYETADLDKKNIYPLRLMYPKKTSKLPEVILPKLEDVGSDDGQSSAEKSEWAVKRIVNFQKTEGCAWSETKDSSDSNDTNMIKPQYKWKGMHGSLGDYEARDSSSNRSTFPIRLLYSKKPVGDLRSATEAKDQPAFIPKLEERYYNWKGKRGSIGDYETLPSVSRMNSIFPIRMLYPKTSPTWPSSSTTSTRKRTKGRIPWCSISDIFPSKTLYPKTTSKRSSYPLKTKKRSYPVESRNNDETSAVQIPKLEERCYDWKGRRGSIGLYETKSSSTKGCIYPLRLFYPKVRPGQEVSDWHPKKDKTKKKEQRTTCAKKTKDYSKLLNKDVKFLTSAISSFSAHEMDERTKDFENKTDDFLKKFEISEEEKSYFEWGKRNGIDEFVTIDSSLSTSLGSISFSGMLDSQSSYSMLLRSKSATENHSSEMEKSGGYQRNGVNEDGTVNEIGGTVNRPQLRTISSWDSSQRTTITGFSEDDSTSMERGSFSSNGSGYRFKRQINNYSENKPGNSWYPRDVETALVPEVPNARFSRKTKQGICMWPTEDETNLLSRIPEVKSKKYKQPRLEGGKKFREVWKPAKYEIPDEIADIKSKGIYAPIGHYFSRETKTGLKPNQKRKNTRRLRSKF